MSDWITPQRAAELYPMLGNADWFRKQLRLGVLRGSKPGKGWVTTTAAVEDFVEGHSNTTARRRRRRAS